MKIPMEPRVQWSQWDVKEIDIDFGSFKEKNIVMKGEINL
jgi:hypothetical protein